MAASRKKKNRKTSGQNLGNVLSLICVMIVVAAMACVVGYSARSLREKEKDYIAREQDLERMIAMEEERASQLEDYKVYVQTKQYVEEVAKERLGLVKEDEILFKGQKKR